MGAYRRLRREAVRANPRQAVHLFRASQHTELVDDKPVDFAITNEVRLRARAIQLDHSTSTSQGPQLSLRDHDGPEDSKAGLVDENIAIVDPEGFVALRQGVFSHCGNRGPIDKNGAIEKQRDHQNWIYCLTSALEDPNEFMATGTYTDLFFLDEATALSAGHRPCWQCITPLP